MYKLSLPIDEWRSINEKSGTSPPKEVPAPLKIGGLNIACGPIVKLCGTFESGPSYRATIMIVAKDLESSSKPIISYTIGSLESSTGGEGGKGGEFTGVEYFNSEGYSFWRFNVNLTMTDVEQRVLYYINDDKKFKYEFFIPAVNESMNVMSYSCNGFSLGVDPADFKSSPWFDVLKRHDTQHYHVMLGGGDQIYSDSIKLKCSGLEKWMDEKNPLKKRKMPATEEIVNEFHHYYLNHYMAWFGKGFWEGKENKTTLQSLYPVAMSTIPSVNIWDDHDIIDGFGSYNDHTMKQPIFSSIGNVAYLYYMLFQHHMLPEEKIHNSSSDEPSWILLRRRAHSLSRKIILIISDWVKKSQWLV